MVMTEFQWWRLRALVGMTSMLRRGWQLLPKNIELTRIAPEKGRTSILGERLIFKLELSEKPQTLMEMPLRSKASEMKVPPILTTPLRWNRKELSGFLTIRWVLHRVRWKSSGTWVWRLALRMLQLTTRVTLIFRVT